MHAYFQERLNALPVNNGVYVASARDSGSATRRYVGDLPASDQLLTRDDEKIAVDRDALPHSSQQIDGSKGKGLFASRAFQRGDVIFVERKLLGLEDKESRELSRTCEFCMRCVGPLEAQVQRLCRAKQPFYELPYKPHSLDRPKVDAVSIGGDGNDINGDGNAVVVSWPLPDCVLEPVPVECSNRCGAEYCSEQCRERAYRMYHAPLCIRNTVKSVSIRNNEQGEDDQESKESCWYDPDLPPFVAFQQHSHATNHTFELVAKVYAHLFLKIEEETTRTKGGDLLSSKEALLRAIAPFSYFTQEVWWHQVQTPQDVAAEGEAAIAEFRSSMIDSVERALFLLNNVFTPQLGPCHVDLSRKRAPVSLAALAVQSLASSKLSKGAYFTEFTSFQDLLWSPTFFGSILGMFEMNNIGTASRSTLLDYLDHINEIVKPAAKRGLIMSKALGQKTWKKIKEGSDVYPSGTGLYVIGCCMNHSCRPNVAVMKLGEGRDDVTSFMATRSIENHEELCISYIDEDVEYEERTRQLADYLFTCQCMRCRRCQEGFESEGGDESDDEGSEGKDADEDEDLTDCHRNHHETKVTNSDDLD